MLIFNYEETKSQKRLNNFPEVFELLIGGSGTCLESAWLLHAKVFPFVLSLLPQWTLAFSRQPVSSAQLPLSFGSRNDIFNVTLQSRSSPI
jgi:hypothetical protein